LSTEFGELPLVPCYLGEINQVVLNLLVNASHAISDVVKDSGALGKLTVGTRLDGDVRGGRAAGCGMKEVCRGISAVRSSWSPDSGNGGQATSCHTCGV